MAKKEEALTQAAPKLAPIPDHLKTGQQRGLQNAELKDMLLPRLALCQAMTPARQKSKPDKFIPGLEEGQFFNTVSGNIYGEKVAVVPLFFFKSRIFFKDINQGGGIICQAPDGKSCQLNHGGPCLHNTWGPSGEPPECTEFFNYATLRYPERELIIVSLKATALKAGKTWNSLIRMRGADMFAGIYMLESTTATNKAGQVYYAPRVSNHPETAWVDADFFKYATEQYNAVFEGLASGSMKVDETGLAEEALADDDRAVAEREAAEM